MSRLRSSSRWRRSRTPARTPRYWSTACTNGNRGAQPDARHTIRATQTHNHTATKTEGRKQPVARLGPAAAATEEGETDAWDIAKRNKVDDTPVPERRNERAHGRRRPSHPRQRRRCKPVTQGVTTSNEASAPPTTPLPAEILKATENPRTHFPKPSAPVDVDDDVSFRVPFATDSCTPPYWKLGGTPNRYASPFTVKLYDPAAPSGRRQHPSDGVRQRQAAVTACVPA